MKSSKSIVNEVTELVTPVVEALGYTLWDVEYEKTGAEYHLTLTIDKEDGINIEDCEKVSRALDPVLDEADPIQDEYHLDVSSPGIERAIRTDFHLSKCIGDTVQVRLYAPLDGKKAIIGELISYNEDTVTVNDGEEIQIPRKSVAKMNVYFEF